MEALRKELAEASARSSGQSSPAGIDTPRTKSTDDLSDGVSPLMISTPLPMDSRDSFSSLDTTEVKKDQ